MDFSFDQLLETCGYLATFLGTLLEGEISLITSVISAKLGYFNFYVAMVAGFAGAWVSDWFKYIVGKTKGQALLLKRPKLQVKFDKYSDWFNKHPYLILTVYKFLFGFTTVILVMSGLKNIPYWRFALHSGIAVALWTIVLGGFGYFCGTQMIENFKFLSAHKLEVIAFLSLVAFAVWFFKKRPFQKACIDC